MNEFALMSNALNFTYKALEGKKMDYLCLRCGEQFNANYYFAHTIANKPDQCPSCGGPPSQIADAAEAEKREAENRAINKHDERLAEQESERIIDSCKKKWLDYIARKETKDE